MSRSAVIYSEQKIDRPSMANGDIGYSIRVLKSPEEVNSVREIWERWQGHPNTDLEHFLLICRIRTNIHRPHVIVVSYNGGPRAILVARLEHTKVEPTIGYISPICLPANQISVLYGGVLGDTNEVRVAELMVQSLKGSLSNGEADIVEFYHLAEHSLLLNIVLARISLLRRDSRAQSSIHWELSLDKGRSSILLKLSSKHRYWIRRKARELESSFPNRVSHVTFRPGANVQELCSDLETVGLLTYQRGLGAGFVDDPEHRARFELFNSRNQLRAWSLCIDGAPRAFCIGSVYKNVFYFAETGYDPGLRSFEIGTLIFIHMVDELTREGVSKIDFGFGQAFYKERFGDRSWREDTIRIYAPTLKGFTSHGYIEGCALMTRAAQRLLHRVGLFDKVKTGWRRRLARRQQPENP